MRNYRHKKVSNNVDNVVGEVVWQSRQAVQVKYEGDIRVYNINYFETNFSIIGEEEKKRKIARKYKTVGITALKTKVIKWLNQQYPYEDIQFERNKSEYELKKSNSILYSVRCNGVLCGYIKFRDNEVVIGYQSSMSSPLLEKYRVRWWVSRKIIQYAYRFRDFDEQITKDMFVCLGELIYAHREKLYDKIYN